MMPGQALVTVAIGPQKSSGFVLKKIMNIPPPNILEDQDDGKNQHSKLDTQSAPFSSRALASAPAARSLVAQKNRKFPQKSAALSFTAHLNTAVY